MRCSSKLKRPELISDGHALVEHDALMAALRDQARSSEKGTRLKAAQAMRYAKKRQEGLVDWHFDTSGVAKKALITWAGVRVQAYFQRE